MEEVPVIVPDCEAHGTRGRGRERDNLDSSKQEEVGGRRPCTSTSS
jgi:hypothetical protein